MAREGVGFERVGEKYSSGLRISETLVHIFDFLCFAEIGTEWYGDLDVS